MASSDALSVLWVLSSSAALSLLNPPSSCESWTAHLSNPDALSLVWVPSSCEALPLAQSRRAGWVKYFCLSAPFSPSLKAKQASSLEAKQAEFENVALSVQSSCGDPFSVQAPYSPAPYPLSDLLPARFRIHIMSYIISVRSDEPWGASPLRV